MNKPNLLISDHEADVWMKEAWLRVVVIQQRPRQMAASQAAHDQLDNFINSSVTPTPNPAK